ncbi:MAG TPA: nuclear transport factor 2 family protein [Rhizobacter sp.]|nr:nuclear transport factor 2 family protein [Rhizobacter sp.]
MDAAADNNRQLMQAIFAGLAKGDNRLFVESLADDVVMRVTGQYSWSRTFHGKASLLRDLYGHFRQRVQPGGRVIAQSIVAAGDMVAVEARGDMVSTTGQRYDNDYCLVFRLAQGKIVEMREYCDSVLTESALGKFPASAEG